PTRFDQYNRLFPRTRDPQQGAPLRDYFAVFPHLTPFADSTRLAPGERNDSLYRTPRLRLLTQSPPSVFALGVHASVAASSDRSQLSLNSFQIRDGSEKIYVGSRLLTRDADYGIDYATGQVTFKNPDSLFQGGTAQVRAQFEERAAFAVAPTSIYGLAARYDLGHRGTVNFTGLFQKEQSAFTRPPLGFEPSSSFIGGVNTELHFQPEFVTRALNALPGIHTDVPSLLNISAEVATSRPSPNQAGQAYVEEFEAEAGRPLSLAENSWHWGSIPATARGAEPFGIDPAGFDAANAAALTWQNLPLGADGRAIQFLPQQIDPTIRLVGQAQSAEQALWLMLKPDTVLGLADVNTGNPNWVRPHQDGPRWRPITQALSGTPCRSAAPRSTVCSRRFFSATCARAAGATTGSSTRKTWTATSGSTRWPGCGRWRASCASCFRSATSASTCATAPCSRPSRTGSPTARRAGDCTASRFARTRSRWGGQTCARSRACGSPWSPPIPPAPTSPIRRSTSG